MFDNASVPVDEENLMTDLEAAQKAEVMTAINKVCLSTFISLASLYVNL